jgi:glutamate formiminotransferase
MNSIIECVPNFSEGRDLAKVERIAGIIKSFADVKLLDYSSDPDYNRSVFTFIGSLEEVKEAAFCAIAEAIKIIDIFNYDGLHPFIGAADVIPFIPLKNATMEECIDLSHNLAKRVGEELKIPVYLYDEACLRGICKNLAQIRRGGIKRLKKEIKKNFPPDFGPATLHPTAGAATIGARKMLIALNVTLRTKKIEIAKIIAKKIREKDRGLPKVKAIGIFLPRRNYCQVSVNLTDYKITSLSQVLSRIEELADVYNVTIEDGELIGLLPEDAIDNKVKIFFSLSDNKVIDYHL